MGSCNTWTMLSLRLTMCASILFLISIDAAPKPDPYWNWNGIPPLRVIPQPGGAIPVIPPFRGDYQWQGNWNGSPLYNRGADFDFAGCLPGYHYKKGLGRMMGWCYGERDKYCGHAP